MVAVTVLGRRLKSSKFLVLGAFLSEARGLKDLGSSLGVIRRSTIIRGWYPVDTVGTCLKSRISYFCWQELARKVIYTLYD